MVEKIKIANFEKKLSNIISKPCDSPKEQLALVFEEIAAEIRSIEVDMCFLDSLIADMNKAMIRSHDEVEQEEEKGHAS